MNYCLICWFVWYKTITFLVCQNTLERPPLVCMIVWLLSELGSKLSLCVRPRSPIFRQKSINRGLIKLQGFLLNFNKGMPIITGFFFFRNLGAEHNLVTSIGYDGRIRKLFVPCSFFINRLQIEEWSGNRVKIYRVPRSGFWKNLSK